MLYKKIPQKISFLLLILIFLPLCNASGSVEGSVSSSATIIDTTPPWITINVPQPTTYINSVLDFNISLSESGTAWFNLNATQFSLYTGLTNYTMSTTDNRTFNYSMTLPDGTYIIQFYANDSLGFLNDTESVNFTINTIRITGGGTTFIYKINKSILCNLTKESADTGSIGFLNTLQQRYKDLTNETVNLLEVRIYIQDWQILCSDIINSSLKENFVCKKTYDFIMQNGFSLDSTQIENLTSQIRKELPISSNLVGNYIRNFNDKCSSYRIRHVLSIIDEPGKVSYTFLYVFLIFFLLILCFTFYTRLKKILYATLRLKQKKS